MKKYKYSLKFYIIIGVIFMLLITFYSSVMIKFYKKNSLVLEQSTGLYIDNESSFSIKNNEPMTSGEGLLHGNSYKFRISSQTNTDDLYYGIYLYRGEKEKNKERFLDSDIYFALFKNNKLVTSPVSFNKINGNLLYSSEYISVDNYDLKFWLSENILISDSLYKNRSNYSVNDFNKRYANFNLVIVPGKADIPYNSGSVTLLSDYKLGLDYNTALISKTDILIHFLVTKKPSFLVVTNTLNNTGNTYYFNENNGNFNYDLSLEESGKYIYYVVYSDNSRSDIGHFNVRINKS